MKLNLARRAVAAWRFRWGWVGCDGYGVGIAQRPRGYTHIIDLRRKSKAADVYMRRDVEIAAAVGVSPLAAQYHSAEGVGTAVAAAAAAAAL